MKDLERTHWAGKVHQIWRYRWTNGVRLRNADDSPNVNWVELLITAEDGTQRFRIAFVTSHLVAEENVEEVVQAGRARWRIENEDINTLKTKGCHLEHTFGYAARGITEIMPTA